MGALRTNTICKVQNRIVALGCKEITDGRIGKNTSTSREKRMKLLNAKWALKYVFDDSDVSIIDCFVTGL